MLALKRDLGAKASASLAKDVRTLEEQATQLERIDESNKAFESAIRNTLENVQSAFADTFETIYSGGVKSFGDFATEIKDIFIRLAGQLTALMVIRPVLATAAVPLGISGFGTSPFASLFGGAATANTAAGGTATGPGGLLVGGGVTSPPGALRQR